MKRTHRSLGIFALTLSITLGLFCVFLYGLGSVEGAVVAASIDDDEFEVDNSDGPMPAELETTIQLSNSADESRTVYISASRPEGPDTDLTADVYPHIYLSAARKDRDDVGMSERLEIEPGKTDLYITINVNSSAFADIFSFDFTVDNKDDKETETLPVTVEITPYNSIQIKPWSKDDDEITVTAGRLALISLEITNAGNIYKQKIDLEVEGLPENLTLVEIQFPALGSGVRNYVYPQDSSLAERDGPLIVDVKLEADENSGDGKFEITIHPITDGYDAPSGGHPFVEVEVTLKHRQEVKDPGVEDPGEGEFPIAIFGGGLAAIFAVMGGAGYFMMGNKDDDEEEGAWGAGGEEGWGADEWGDEEAYDSGTSAGEYEAPLTEKRAASKPRAAPTPVPRTAPGPAPRPAGPAHVKCPKCKTGVKVSNPKRPLTIGCPKCSTKFTLKGKPGAAQGPKPRSAPGPAPRPAGPAHVKCPKCKTGVKVSNPKRPLTIGCPKCSTKFTLKGTPGAAQGPKPRSAPGPAPKAVGPAHVKCPKCKTGVKVSNPKRPLTIGCPKCSTKFTLKGSSGAAQGPKPRTASGAGPAPKGPALIACPKCSTKFKVSNPKRPLKVACPRCKTGLNLK
jgi:DNA-directed RNA polymerase subunit RPC12/RpoP